jgi:hypothetical protein
LSPGEVRSDPIRNVQIRLEDDAPLSPLTFTVDFADEHGNEWSDTFRVEVVR